MADRSIADEIMNETDERQAVAPKKDTRAGVRLIPAAVICVAIGAFFGLGLDSYFTLSSVREHHELLTAAAHDNLLLGALGFLVLYALLVALSFPGAVILSLVAGFLFGWVLGSVLVVMGATTGAVAVFLAARTALPDHVLTRAGAWLPRLESGFRENAFNYLLFLRLLPVVPFWLLNLAPALLGMRTLPFTLATAIGIIPGTVVYVGVGNGLGASLAQGADLDLGSVILQWEVLVPLLGLSALSLLPVAIKHFRPKQAAVVPEDESQQD